MHEVFLQRLTAHPRLRGDSVFTVFLEFDGDVSKFMHLKPRNCLILFVQLSIRQKNTRERLGSIFKGIAKGVDEMYLHNHKVHCCIPIVHCDTCVCCVRMLMSTLKRRRHT